jgi:hypothetical protein
MTCQHVEIRRVEDVLGILEKKVWLCVACKHRFFPLDGDEASMEVRSVSRSKALPPSSEKPGVRAGDRLTAMTYTDKRLKRFYSAFPRMRWKHLVDSEHAVWLKVWMEHDDPAAVNTSVLKLKMDFREAKSFGHIERRWIGPVHTHLVNLGHMYPSLKLPIEEKENGVS